MYRYWDRRTGQWSFADSWGCIDAVASDKPEFPPLSDTLLKGYQVLGTRVEPPRQPYSHWVGTCLDRGLEEADMGAKVEALCAQPEVGWIRGLQELMVCFTMGGVHGTT